MEDTCITRRVDNELLALRGHLVGHGKDDCLSHNTAEFGKNAGVREGGAPPVRAPYIYMRETFMWQTRRPSKNLRHRTAISAGQ